MKTPQSHARIAARIALVAAMIGIVLTASTRRADACVILGGGGTTKVSGEEVLIVWDAAQRTEHFIRRLSFRDASADFGFLVPTPSRPNLGEVEDDVFGRLFEIYRAPDMPRARSAARSRGGAPLMAAAAQAPAVQVVEQTRVAGLDATVLAATDAAALNAWLGAHHYPSSAALTAYLAPYVRDHYFVTAFRFAPGASNRAFGTRNLRMSFTSERPYFPYAEPRNAPRVPGRVFRISVVSNERVEARVGTRAWSASTTRFAGQSSEIATALQGVVPASAISPQAWLTTFQENSSTRGRDDLFFERSRTQVPVAPTLTNRVE